MVCDEMLYVFIGGNRYALFYHLQEPANIDIAIFFQVRITYVSEFELGKCSMDLCIYILQAAEHFFSGGTDFEKPLSQALKLLENGYENADIVFITDGECAISQEFVANYYAVKKVKHFQVTGILLDKKESNTGISLIPFCDKIYRSSEFSNDAIALQVLSKKI